MIRVLIVDDSPVVAQHLSFILTSDPEIEVVATAGDGRQAIEYAQKHRPNLITMDVNMPRMGGFEATRHIMETEPVPIVIVSATSESSELATSFHAIEAGAVAVLKIPPGLDHPDHQSEAANFIQTIKTMSEVRLVKRWRRVAQKEDTRIVRPLKRKPLISTQAEIKVVAIGASTGGPPALQTIFSELPMEFPLPVLVVQHITPGFTQGFIDWLNQTSMLPIQLARHGEELLPGHIYVAPDHHQMGVDSHKRILLQGNCQENGLCPSVSYLFRTIANQYADQAVGILLTGMGKDGAAELRLMKERGAVTIAQDEESSVIFGMPGEAVKLDAALHMLSPFKIADALKTLINSSKITNEINP